MMRIRIQLSYVIQVQGELPDMTRDISAGFEGATKALYPGLAEAIEKKQVKVDIEADGRAGFTRLKAKR